MSGWTQSELERIGAARELEVAATDATVPVWVVRVGDGLYVRSWHGEQARWFRAVRASGRGRIRADGIARDVRFVPAGDADDAVDDAYRAKYAGRYAGEMVASPARETTLRVEPLDS